VVFFHKEPLATNIWNVNFQLIPKHIYEESYLEDPSMQNSKYHIALENNPVCGGPYNMVRRVRGQDIVLERRESYYVHNGKQVRDKPYFKTGRFRILEDSNTARLALMSGNIDEAELTAEQWRTQTSGDDFYERNTKATGQEWLEYHFMWNLKRPYFSDVRVRKAMAYAFDYDYMLKELCYGLYEPSTGNFAPSSWMASKRLKPYEQDLDKAEELLDEAGWEDHDGDGIRDKDINGKNVRFEFSLNCRADDVPIAICTLMKENLGRIGIICNVKPLEGTVVIDKAQRKDFDASFGGWGAGADPDTSTNIWGTGEGRNYVSYSNPEVDRLFEQGRKVADRAERAKIYAQIHEILYEDQPYCWLYYLNAFYGFNKDLRGYRFSPRGPYHYSPGFSSIWKVAL
jgi:peptide/nickel transport system substrate-binding protein